MSAHNPQIRTGWLLLDSCSGLLAVDSFVIWVLPMEYSSAVHLTYLVCGIIVGAVLGTVFDHVLRQMILGQTNKEEISRDGSSPGSILGILWCILVQLAILHVAIVVPTLAVRQ